jgi:Putative MetA-pathway of phenol degradation
MGVLRPDNLAMPIHRRERLRPDSTISPLLVVVRSVIPALLIALSTVATSGAQELEPRRWGHLPANANIHGFGYAFIDGDLSFDPVLQIDDATFELHTVGLKYIRTLDLFGFSARLDVAGAYQEGTWKGLLEGVPSQVNREGWRDPIVRFAVNLYGAPPLEGKAYADYRSSLESETIVGAAVAVQVPLGEYLDDKLINLGTNRFTIRPQLGVLHNRGKWGFEFTGSIWIYTDNDDFFDGNKLENDPFYAIQGHVQYHFLPTLWLAAGAAFGIGQESTVNGENKNDRRENLVFGVNAGYAITRHFGVNVGYLGTRALADTGLDFDSFVVSATFFWPDSWLRAALSPD